jgi:pimeloyl-ACP methyl ester carboxylesterase
VLLSGAGHMPMMAQPRQVAEALTRFVAQPLATSSSN